MGTKSKEILLTDLAPDADDVLHESESDRNDEFYQEVVKLSSPTKVGEYRPVDDRATAYDNGSLRIDNAKLAQKYLH